MEYSYFRTIIFLILLAVGGYFVFRFFSFRVIIFLFLLTVGGYYVLWFFSKLTDINMFSAMAQCFRAEESKNLLDTYEARGRWLHPVVVSVFYLLICLVVVFHFSTIPGKIFAMNKYHAGGLLGFCDVGKASVYDHMQRAYIAYEYSNPPLPASTFTETFNLILFYKPSYSEYYVELYAGIETLAKRLFINLVMLLIAAFLLAGLYQFLYTLAGEHIKLNGLPNKLSRAFMAAQFHKIVGMRFIPVLSIFLSVVLLAIGAEFRSVQKLNNHYTGLYESDQKTLKSALLNKVSPQDTIKGVVKRRFKSVTTSSTSTGSGSSRRTITHHYHFSHYTIEFKDLIWIPVYLNLRIPTGTNSYAEEINELDKAFPDQIAVMPNEMKEFTFTVNPDYSIWLMKDKIKSQE